MPRTKRAAVQKKVEQKLEKSKATNEKSDEDSSKGKFVKVNQPLLQLNKNGGVTKSKKPIAAATKQANKVARMAMVTGELSKEEIQRKTERDLRTLYIRFKSSDTAPTSEKEIKALESSIKDVRVPRQGKLKEGKRIRYAFVEFSSEKVCESMKDKLAANPDFFVDFVGVKSNSKGGPKNKSKPINPVRLHVSGFGSHIDADKLKKLFPKCRMAEIPQQKSGFGFVTFSNPADAKAAFDAANKLKIGSDTGDQHMTVVFARKSHLDNVERADDKPNKKRKKSNKKTDEIAAKKTKSENTEEDEQDEENGAENDDDKTAEEENEDKESEEGDETKEKDEDDEKEESNEEEEGDEEEEEADDENKDDEDEESDSSDGDVENDQPDDDDDDDSD